MIMEKMENDLFYNIRHLKTFRKSSGNEDVLWAYRWPGGGNIQVYNKLTDRTMFTLGHDPQLAEYICSLNNMCERLLKEVESKYDKID